MSNNTKEITKWVKIALGTDDCAVEIEGCNAPDEGYLSDVSFVKATLGNGEEKNLAVKVCKPEIRKTSKGYSEREMFFYKEIMPTLLDFQKEKNVKQPFTALPKCYKTFTDEDIEVIVLENLKRRGFITIPRGTILDMTHLKLVLKNYAKFHALSLALKDQRRDVFDNLEQRCHNFLPKEIRAYGRGFEKAVPNVEKFLEQAGRKDLAEKYEKLMAEGPKKMSVDAYGDVPEERVFGHNDCHTGNILIKYEDGDTTNLQEIVLIDFQIANIHSPILDVAAVIMTMISNEEFSHFKEFTDCYYQELSSFLTELGSDARKIFPESTMWNHWEKYAISSFLMLSSFMKKSYSDDGKPRMDKRAERLVALVDFYLNNDNYRK